VLCWHCSSIFLYYEQDVVVLSELHWASGAPPHVQGWVLTYAEGAMVSVWQMGISLQALDDLLHRKMRSWFMAETNIVAREAIEEMEHFVADNQIAVRPIVPRVRS
jgi:hypothetical protein